LWLLLALWKRLLLRMLLQLLRLLPRVERPLPLPRLPPPRNNRLTPFMKTAHLGGPFFLVLSIFALPFRST
jgi:hypothetical protein